MNKILMETIKDFINDSIKEATEFKETLSQIESDDTIEKLNKIRKVKKKNYADDSIKEATEFKETLSQIEAEDIVKRNKEIINKIKKKSYIEQRAEGIMNECNINNAIEEYYKLGVANAYGYIMYMIDQDFDKKDIKKFIIDGTKDDSQFRCDLFGVWGELYDRSK